jgi:hypothetical protein
MTWLPLLHDFHRWKNLFHIWKNYAKPRIMMFQLEFLSVIHRWQVRRKGEEMPFESDRSHVCVPSSDGKNFSIYGKITPSPES